MNNLNIVHDPQHKMFLTHVKGGVAKLSYSKPEEGLLNYKETFVPEESRKKGVAHKMAEYALEFAKNKNYRVKVSCPFVKEYVEKNDEFDDIIEEKVEK